MSVRKEYTSEFRGQAALLPRINGNARKLIDAGVPLAISKDYCSSIHATSLLSTMTIAAPWFRQSPRPRRLSRQRSTLPTVLVCKIAEGHLTSTNAAM